MNRECPAFGTDSLDLSAQRRLVDGLCRREAFPHPVQRIRLIETHISFVILTGRFAYKIKKAINLGFLDYSARGRRRHFCEEELRLNRRLAAPLYLDVVAIGGTVDAPSFGDTSPVLEYAVKMAEFEQDWLLDALLARGQLLPADIDALARLIADFHRRAPAAAPGSDYGSGATVDRAMLANFAALRSIPEWREISSSAKRRSEVEGVEDWCRREMGRLLPVVESRRRAGRIRECHGDLHLGNVVRLPDGLLVFDCIEFSADFRWIDVLSEVAFFCMDVAARGRPDLGYRFLNDYLESFGDYEALGVFRFYFVYRALVRAKVNGIRAAQVAASPAEHSAALASCRSYLALAAREVAPRRVSMILTHGFSGAGKTYLARQLRDAMPAVGIRSDVERKRLHELSPLAASASAPDAGIYGRAATVATYRRLLDLARSVLDSGYSVVVDAAFLSRWQRDDFRQLAAALEVPLVILDCVAPPELLIERVERRKQRADDASEADAEILARQLATAEPLAAEESGRVVRVAAGAEIGAVVDQVRRLVAG